MTAIETALLLPGKFAAWRQGLEVVGDVTETQWHHAGAALSCVEKSMPWLIGDWILVGERQWGKTYKEAMEITGLEYGTLRNAVSVCRSIELSRRRDKLSFKHHAEVASLDPEAQDELLDAAESGTWSTSVLRAQVRVLKGLPEDGHDQDEQGADEAQQRKSDLPVEYPRDADLVDGLDEDDLDACVAEDDVDDAYLDDEFSDGDADEASDKDRNVVEPSGSQEHQGLRAGILRDLSRVVRKWKSAGASAAMILRSFQEIAQRERDASAHIVSGGGDPNRGQEADIEKLEPVDSALGNVMEEGAGDVGAAGRAATPPVSERSAEPNNGSSGCDISDEAEPGEADIPIEGDAIFEGGILEYEDAGKVWQCRRSGSFFFIRERDSSNQEWLSFDSGTLYDRLTEEWRRVENEGSDEG